MQTKPDANKHIPALDGLRGLAVLLVFLYHYAGGAQSSNLILRVLGTCNHANWFGVTLFFLLSGFLISGILWDGRAQPDWWRRFYWRRTLRIFPLYFAALLLVLCSAALVHRGRDAFDHLWVYALYLQNIPRFFSAANAVGSPLHLSHLWSLAVEEQFYLLWPFLLIGVRTLRRAKFLCIAVVILSALFRFGIWEINSVPLDYAGSLPARAGELALGGWLAICFRDPESWRRIQRLAPWAWVAGGLGFLCVAGVAHSFSLYSAGMFLFGLPCVTLALASVLALSLGEGVVMTWFDAAWLRWLGGISYGVYIFHVLLAPVFQWMAALIAPHATRNQSLALTFFIAGGATLALAQISFVYFERPLLDLKDRPPEGMHRLFRAARRHPLTGQSYAADGSHS
jgi:peptidoglycan/LPS O-acetylase OafA/YrhL